MSLADVAARAGGPIGRPHIADALVAAGHARDRQDAFDRYLADGGPAYVPHEGMEPRGGGAAHRRLGRRRRAGPPGVAADGRPATWRVSCGACAGGASRASRSTARTTPPSAAADLAELARPPGLVACGGSDFHRPGEGLRPGDTGDPPLPPDVVDRLLPAGRGGPSASVNP